MSNKLGLDYFNIDVDIFNDPKIIKLIKRYGPLGLSSYLITLSNIYQKGYYLEASVDDLAQIILSTITGKFVSGNYKLQEIIYYMAEIQLFSQEMMKAHIITSKGIQKRFILMTKKRKNQDLSNYWLLDPVKPAEASLEEPVISYEDDIYANLTKEEKKRIKKKEGTRKKIAEHGPNKHYLTSCLINYKYIDEYDLDIHRYNLLFQDLYQAYDQETVFKAVRYICNYAAKKTVSIENKYYFFEKSITANLERLTKPVTNFANASFEDFMKDLL